MDAQVRFALGSILKERTMRDSAHMTIFSQVIADGEMQDLEKPLPVSDLELLVSTIASRFGNITGAPRKIGSTETYHVVVDPELGMGKLRLKGFNNVGQARRNLLPADMLYSERLSGFNTIIGCAPSRENPICIVMLEGDSNAALALAEESKTAIGMPDMIKTVFDLFGEYACTPAKTKSTHEDVKDAIDLMQISMLYDIARGNFVSAAGQESSEVTQDRNKTRVGYWSGEIQRVCAHIKNKVLRSTDIAMRVANDASLDNIILFNPRGGQQYAMFTDQGYSPEILEAWRRLTNTGSDCKTNPWLGRVEFTVGQMVHSIVANENVYSDKLSEPLNAAVLRMIGMGEFIGLKQNYIMPGEHNPELSNAMYFLGLLHMVIHDMLRHGENDERTACANNYISRIFAGVRYIPTRDMIGAEKSFG